MTKNYIIVVLCFIGAMMISAKPTTCESTGNKNETALIPLTGDLTISPASIAGVGYKSSNNAKLNPLTFIKTSGHIKKNQPGTAGHLSGLLEADATVGNIIDPAPGLICSSVITPKITVRNIGSDLLNTIQIGMILDGSPVGTLKTVTNLSLSTSDYSQVITLSPNIIATAGIHELKIYTKNPNGNTDFNPVNDTATIVFTVTAALSLPYKESFESENFPPANGSDTINGDDGSITWQRTTDAGSPGNASLFLDGFDYENARQRDIYRTPKINVALLDSVVLYFNVAYKEYEGKADSLLILYSPDCGNSWYPSGYAKGGPELSTSPGYTTDYFIPGSSEWRSERVVLKDFCLKGIQSLMIGFQSYNDYGNNIYVDGINIAGFASPSRNASLNSIDDPQFSVCTNSIIPVVNFSNVGKDSIHSLKINYQVDGGAITTYNWTGSLGKCGTASTTLATASPAAGTHVLTVFLSAPDGLNDLATSNDTLRKIFTVYNTTPLSTPVSEDFETPAIPRDNWGIQNPDGLVTWKRTTAASKSGAASLWINNPAASNAKSATDNFISPVIANNNNIDSMFVTWDYAYKQGVNYPGSTTRPLDTLELLVTKDCGASFISVWKKWGAALQTVNDPNYADTTAFIPTIAEWQSASMYLTPFVASADFQVYFSAKSNKQNNMWLDNVRIISKTLPQRLKSQGYLIYPNPFTGSFVVHHFLPPAGLQSIQLLNAAGQLVLDKRFSGNAATEITVKTGNISAGVYILKMMYSDKTVEERIVKN